MMSDNIDRTLKYAIRMHADQKRRYTNEPYVFHSMAVADIVRTVPHSEVMIQAALLHDVVEDVAGVKFEDIKAEFGEEVAKLVYYLTDVSSGMALNRAQRKKLDREHYASGPAEAQTIKVADMIDNTASIHQYDGQFWHNVYKHEKKQLLDALTKADPALVERARKQIQEAW